LLDDKLDVMKKVLIAIGVILISVAGAVAQTGSKGQLARLNRKAAAEKRASATGRKVKESAPGVLRVGPSTIYLKNGLRAGEVVRFLGQPATRLERRGRDSRLATYTFARGDGRVLVAEFENGRLISSHIAAAGDNHTQRDGDDDAGQ
jgi:hypothetical protein